MECRGIDLGDVLSLTRLSEGRTRRLLYLRGRKLPLSGRGITRGTVVYCAWLVRSASFPSSPPWLDCVKSLMMMMMMVVVVSNVNGMNKHRIQGVHSNRAKSDLIQVKTDPGGFGGWDRDGRRPGFRFTSPLRPSQDVVGPSASTRTSPHLDETHSSRAKSVMVRRRGSVDLASQLHPIANRQTTLSPFFSFAPQPRFHLFPLSRPRLETLHPTTLDLLTS